MSKELNEDVLVIVDLETTGLNPTNGWILEVGSVLANAKTLEVIDQRSWVVRPLAEMRKAGPFAAARVATIEEAKARADSYVLKMHTDNGLWDEVAAATQTLLDVGKEFPHWLHENGLRTSDTVYTLMGRGPDRFDRVWLRQNGDVLQRMDDLFHYRSLDVSNIHHAFRRAGHPLGEDLLRTPPKHRAVPDCLDTLADWRHIVHTIEQLPT